MRGLSYLPLLLSFLYTVNGAATYDKRVVIEDNADLDAHLSKRVFGAHDDHFPEGHDRLYPRDDAYNHLKDKRAVPPEVEAARNIIKQAQVAQAKKNRDRFRNPIRPTFELRPPRKASKSSQRVASSSAGDPSISDEVTDAAKIIAEFEAPTYNETLPDLGADFPKLEKRQGGAFWMEGVAHGAVAIGGSSGYQVFRNVKDFGAVGDGRTDDTAAINLAISSGDRCGDNCGSSTVKPALVYFPSGTYLVSKSLIGYYNTQMVGSAANPPILRAASSFVGLGVISSNVYVEGASGGQWYINQNNFMRQVRNFIIDMRAIPNVMEGQGVRPAGIHWQVAQATSLQNIQIIMSSRADTTHLGIFMENGSGGFMSDVTFSGGAIGAYLGNQQYTIRKFSFTGCKIAVETHWNWVFSAKSFLINNCQLGFNISAGAGNGQGTGSITIMDTIILNTPKGIASFLSGTNRTSLIIDNLKLINVPIAVTSNGATVLPGGTTVIDSWGAGIAYDDSDAIGYRGKAQQGGTVLFGNIAKPAELLDENGNWFERSKPQYADVPASGFYDVKARGGARGNGRSDDTAALNNALAAATAAGQIAYFPHGIYLVTDTVFIPPGAKIVGEVWSQIQASGSRFNDAANPRVMLRVGNPGDVGNVEIQDLIFGVKAPTAGAILMEWNIKASAKGSAGIWDTHWRVGGSIGSNLQAGQCPKLTGKINPNCIAGSMLFHITKGATGYFENLWAWTSDHDLDVASQDQIDIYVGRGILIESQGPTWLYGTASEHNVLYQYQLQGAKNVFMSLIQTESPYYQTAPGAPAPFPYQAGSSTPAAGRRDLQNVFEGNASASMDSLLEKRQASGISSFTLDPGFRDCDPTSITCPVSWALRIVQSEDVHLYGAGLYSWFQNYDQGCLRGSGCQWNVAQVDGATKKLRMQNFVTVGASVMLNNPRNLAIFADKNRNGFASSALGFESVAGSGGSFGDDGGASLGYDGQAGGSDELHVRIISSSRVPPGEDLAIDRSNQKYYWEAYIGEPGDTLRESCLWYEARENIGKVISPKPSGVFGSYIGPPSKATIIVQGNKCVYQTTATTEWLFFNEGDKYGELSCEGFSKKFDCVKIGGQVPRQPDTYCSDNFWFIEDVKCDLVGYKSLEPRNKNFLAPADITLEFFRRWMRTNARNPTQPFYQPNRQLFYTQRRPENHWEGRPGLSDRARHLAARVGLYTIWEGWPSVRYDGQHARDNDFYDLDGFLRNIQANPPPHTNGRHDYFMMMSTIFAQEASGTVWVMTEDPRRIMMTNIWLNAEYRTLAEGGRDWVQRIIAVDLEGGNPHVIFSRFPDGVENRATPQNPIRWTGPMPWNWPVRGLPPDNDGPPRPSGSGSNKRDDSWVPEEHIHFETRDMRDAREVAEREFEKFMKRAGPAEGSLAPPKSPVEAAVERRQLDGYIFERADYGVDCLQTLYALWGNMTSVCEPFDQIFSTRTYEKIQGVYKWNDFFG
ncbi:hypothetical protein TWF506_002680 [Arthrobotrys conoides]|uniref:Rhamnogalacturonase A/B/Epimerase-like pectate lyase domain-containing protein n=1 Tax=Arthrobotrys conoides TaxID=74498 RepID=A0AAN8NIP1_9PEZI